MELSSNVRSKSFVGLTELLIVAGLMLCLGCRNNDKQSDKTAKEVAKHATSFAEHAFKLDVATVDGGLKIDIRENDKTVQTINYRYPEDYEAYPDTRETKCTLQDANFDEHKDLLIPLGLFGNQQLARYDCYVWDTAKAKFIHSPSFIEIANPTICMKKNVYFLLKEVPLRNTSITDGNIKRANSSQQPYCTKLTPLPTLLRHTRKNFP